MMAASVAALLGASCEAETKSLASGMEDAAVSALDAEPSDQLGADVGTRDVYSTIPDAGPKAEDAGVSPECRAAVPPEWHRTWALTDSWIWIPGFRDFLHENACVAAAGGQEMATFEIRPDGRFVGETAPYGFPAEAAAWRGCLVPTTDDRFELEVVECVRGGTQCEPESVGEAHLQQTDSRTPQLIVERLGEGWSTPCQTGCVCTAKCDGPTLGAGCEVHVGWKLRFDYEPVD